MGTGKIPYSSFKVQWYLPILGLARVCCRVDPSAKSMGAAQIEI